MSAASAQDVEAPYFYDGSAYRENSTGRTLARSAVFFSFDTVHHVLQFVLARQRCRATNVPGVRRPRPPGALRLRGLKRVFEGDEGDRGDRGDDGDDGGDEADEIHNNGWYRLRANDNNANPVEFGNDDYDDSLQDDNVPVARRVYDLNETLLIAELIRAVRNPTDPISDNATWNRLVDHARNNLRELATGRVEDMTEDSFNAWLDSLADDPDAINDVVLREQQGAAIVSHRNFNQFLQRNQEVDTEIDRASDQELDDLRTPLVEEMERLEMRPISIRQVENKEYLDEEAVQAFAVLANPGGGVLSLLLPFGGNVEKATERHVAQRSKI
ncbi:hypothetical protein CYMTET_53429 [Cymbomonas tetramitiformis]|uniref:Uncharacterized protein n=1 Tax=Cymbomonas tetramitiformis TaxID=36881 RepID=A0AAE0BGX4_9CHLO|nr:hypothetical protein CYMTET_53429 [Cymbomonas tetramitiformis]